MRFGKQDAPISARPNAYASTTRARAGFEERFLDFIYQPIFDNSGAVTGVLVQGHDVTDQVEARDQQDLLINELNHRVKNTLAVVQGLASQSFRNVPDSGEARASFDQRLHALATAHGILTEQNWKAARLVDTIRSSIEATLGSDISRVSMSGPDIELAPQAAISTAMLTHELATNARKYGSLSQALGEITIEWTLKRRSQHCLLAIDWTEPRRASRDQTRAAWVWDTAN